MTYLGVDKPGHRASGMFEIGRPNLDWVRLAKGHGSARHPGHVAGGFCQGTASEQLLRAEADADRGPGVDQRASACAASRAILSEFPARCR